MFYSFQRCLTCCYSVHRPYRHYSRNGHPCQHRPLSTWALWSLWFEDEWQSSVHSNGALSLLHKRACPCRLRHCGETAYKYETVHCQRTLIKSFGKHFVSHSLKPMSPQVLMRKQWKPTSEPCLRMLWGNVSWLTGELAVFCQVISNSAIYVLKQLLCLFVT